MLTSFISYLVLYPFAHLASDQCKYCNYYINAYEKLSVKTDQYKNETEKFTNTWPFCVNFF